MTGAHQRLQRRNGKHWSTAIDKLHDLIVAAPGKAASVLHFVSCTVMRESLPLPLPDQPLDLAPHHVALERGEMVDV